MRQLYERVQSASWLFNVADLRGIGLKAGYSMGDVASAPTFQSDETALTAGLLAGSEEAFARLSARFHQPVYSLLARTMYDRARAADLTQEVFVKLYREVRSIRGESSLRIWIYRVALREAAIERRWRMRHKRQEILIESPHLSCGECRTPTLLKHALVESGRGDVRVSGADADEVTSGRGVEKGTGTNPDNPDLMRHRAVSLRGSGGNAEREPEDGEVAALAGTGPFDSTTCGSGGPSQVCGEFRICLWERSKLSLFIGNSAGAKQSPRCTTERPVSCNLRIFCVSEPSGNRGKKIPPHNPLLRRSFRWSLPVLLGFISSIPLAQNRQEPLVAELGQNFASGTATVNGVKMYYVRGGDGPAVVLIHGFPQDWYEFHAIMPDLAKRFTVVAIDLPGIGLSAGTQNGYAAADMAKDLHGLIKGLGLKSPYIVGHDIGGMVAYAFTRLFPEEARGVMILDGPLPGIQGWDQIEGVPSVWHIRFMQVPGLAEKLVTGRSADFLDYFFQFAHFTTDEKEHFVSAYSSAAQLHAAFEMYRAFPANARFNASKTGDISVQLFFGAGENSPFAKMVPVFAEGLRLTGCRHVNTGLIPDAVHYIVEDQPAEVAELIERIAAVQPE